MDLESKGIANDGLGGASRIQVMVEMKEELLEIDLEGVNRACEIFDDDEDYSNYRVPVYLKELSTRST